jgi:class 3 adenylate cyclase
VSQVLGVSRYRLEDGLSDLLTGGLAEEHAATHGHSAIQGAVTISSFGIRELSGYEASTPDRQTAAIMFTEHRPVHEGSSPDRRRCVGTTVAGEHRNRAGGIVGKQGGRVWKSTGDGMLASFPTTSQAIRAGQELVLSLAEVGFQLRVGIHLGEVRASGSDLEGIAVNVAARVCAQAEGGSVYLTQVAHDSAEEDVALVSEGSFELKGLPGSWDLIESARHDARRATESQSNAGRNPGPAGRRSDSRPPCACEVSVSFEQAVELRSPGPLNRGNAFSGLPPLSA